MKLQIANEQQKLQDSIRWNTEVNTLRHDLKNHLLCISEYIRLQQTDTAMEYIAKLTGQVKKRTAVSYDDEFCCSQCYFRFEKTCV